MKLSKKWFPLIILILFVSVFIFISFSKNSYNFNGRRLGKEISFSEVYSQAPAEIAKLRIRNGSNGEAYMTYDSEKIQKFLDLMEEITFIRAKDQRDFVGWTYYVDLIDDDEESSWFRISFSRVSFILYGPASKPVRSPYYQMSASFDVIERLDDFFSEMQQSGIALP